MKGISINGYYLHEVEMLMVPYSEGTVSYLRYPKHKIQFEMVSIILKREKELSS